MLRVKQVGAARNHFPPPHLFTQRTPEITELRTNLLDPYCGLESDAESVEA